MGLGCDNLEPRALARLSDAALTALAATLHVCEAVGRWDAASFLVRIVLLPKTDGGLRPIDLFPTIVRVWMRARLPAARAGEEDHASSTVFGGKGVGAQRAAWVAALRAETAAVAALTLWQSVLGDWQ